MYFRYLGRELRRRIRSASVVAIGLALGVGLVITVTAAAAGVKSAQSQVLQSLYGVGTDLTVTQAATAGSGGPFSFGGTPPSLGATRNFSQDRLTSTAGLTTMASTDVASIAGLKDVAGATGALTLSSIHASGTFSSGGFGGAGDATPTATATPSATASPSASATASPSAGSNPFSVSFLTVDGIDPSAPGLGPLSAVNITAGSSIVQQWFDQVDADATTNSQLLALVSSSYAKANSITAGSTVSVAGTDLTVLGVITSTQGSSGADIYAPLSEVQTLAGDTAEINTIYVTADNATDISAIQSEIQTLLPKATVTTAADLASQVSGSLSTATTLANTLGLWLSIAVLLAAFVLAALLTTASVNRRVREFGTLKAIGWRSRRIVGQVLGESVVQGIVGGVIGVGLGVAGAFLVTKVAPTLNAVVGATGLGSTPSTGGGAVPSFAARSGFGGTGTGRSFVRQFANPNHSVTVHLSAPLNPEIFVLAIGLAIVGALIAGAIGGWRVARLQPAEALRRVE